MRKGCESAQPLVLLLTEIRFAQAVSVAEQASKAWCDFIQSKEMPVWVNACSRVIRELMAKKHEA